MFDTLLKWKRSLNRSTEAAISKRLLFFSHENWDEIWRRNQFICAGLHKRHPDLEILWITRPIDLWRFDWQSIKKSMFGQIATVPKFKRMAVIWTTKLLPNRIGQSVNNWLMRKQVVASMHKLGWNGHKCVVWVNNKLPGQCCQSRE